MKRTHSANVGGRVFHIDEDAYEKLRAYLQLIDAHFLRSYPDAADIAADIESRIAEQLQQRDGASQAVQLADVDRVIAAMGSVEEFGGEEGVAAQAPRVERRRLYRDPDHRVIAGVAGGLAAYFGVPPLAVRIAFVALLFFFGTAALVYLLLWFLMPEANSTTEKLQMRGRALTLSAIDQGVRDRLGEIPPDTRNAAANAVTAIGSAIRVLVVTVALFLKRAAGAVVVGSALLALVFLTVLLVMALVNAGAPPLHPEVAEVFASFDAWQHAVKVFIYLIVAIPLVLVATLAAKLSWGMTRFNARSLGALLGIWLVSLLMSAGIWASHYPELRQAMKQPAYYFDVRFAELP
jgi:phage shock protein PspC (stress-responsive transcriptional regulator)